ncbi:asparaginyl/glutamyl-tRNA amidotransferase subunit C [candidate division WOR-1 bacterium RIFOXYB2_FULL_48_7]|uniref:Aspartyl/glutamyl-tRNA(Asn/Gln) amidotransferase subunit C n=1 Tax=candidate division WOR-1 bacterium RIFOXYB2_FULL_48_7 TaxID=1802583 RepID=A0A1F4TJA1_UNCSA|nr:MAG: asparaginyl/glutamyl-tRNA amidotransferase subunit C [candidate division WOR-1 bacterium RIFOXYB2_FULL_48_7]
MQIDVDHVAKLARLGLSDEEKKLFAKQLSDILEFANSLKKIKTDDIPPTTQAIPMKNVFREDQVITCNNIEDILANGPEVESHMFRVPKIME